MLCAIWYHLYNLKNVKNTHGRVLLSVKLQASVCNFTKTNTHPWKFFTFFKLYKSIPNRAKHHIYPYECIYNNFFYTNLYHALLKRYRKKVGEGISSSNTATDIKHTDTTIQRINILFNPLSTNPTKWSNTLKQFVGF